MVLGCYTCSPEFSATDLGSSCTAVAKGMLHFVQLVVTTRLCMHTSELVPKRPASVLQKAGKQKIETVDTQTCLTSTGLDLLFMCANKRLPKK